MKSTSPNSLQENENEVHLSDISTDPTIKSEPNNSSIKVGDGIEEEIDEIKHNIKIRQNLTVGSIFLHEEELININITNVGKKAVNLKDYYFLPSDNKNKLEIYKTPFQKRLQSNEKFVFQLRYTAEYSGQFKESFILLFESFEIRQNILLEVSNKIYEYIDYRKKKVIKSPYYPVKNNRNRRKKKEIRLTKFNPYETEMPQYYLTNNVNTIEKTYPHLLEPLNALNYQHKFHTLLFMMQIEDGLPIKVLNKDSITMTKKGEFMWLKIPEIKKFPSECQIMDTVRVSYQSGPKKYEYMVYEGRIFEIVDDILHIKFHDVFHKQYKGEKLSVDFCKFLQSYKFLNNAVDMAFQAETEMLNILFPKRLISKKFSYLTESISGWFNPKLNGFQKTAVSNFMKNEYNLPYIIFGPPGTGKTIILIEIILQTIILDPKSRILIITPTNKAADNFFERLSKSDFVNKADLIRWISNAASDNYDMTEEHFNAMDAFEFINNRYKIVVSTIGNVLKLMKNEEAYGYFTHLFIDEAGQMTEPEILSALILLQNHLKPYDNIYGKVCLAGDPKQLGPVIMSQIAKKFEIGTSFLERMISTKLYQENACLITQLIHNYRSLATVIQIPNELFYDNSLIAHLDPSNQKIKSDLKALMKIFNKNEKLYNLHDFPGVFFHGVKGKNNKEFGGTSWFNFEEATKVYNYTNLLYKNGFTPDDIGIVTPYLAQIKQIVELFKSKNKCPPQIGSVEKFQGCEKKIIIMSTVRSQSKVSTAMTFRFISCPKRVNVSMTRAELITIVLGDPDALCIHPLWALIIENIYNNNGFIGCDLTSIPKRKNKKRKKIMCTVAAII